MGKIKNLLSNLWCRITAHIRGIYYINGSELLPPPLDKETESEYLELAKTDRTARNKLVEHNLRLVVYIAKRFENTGTGIEDLISIGTMGLIKAINTFNGDKNIRLATYASRCIENEILMYIRKYSGHTEMSIDEPLNVDWDGNELLLSDVLGNEEDTVTYEFEQNEEKRMIHEAVAALDERERVIIQMRYGLDGFREHTQKEAADELGISQSYISRIEKKILERLKGELAGKI